MFDFAEARLQVHQQTSNITSSSGNNLENIVQLKEKIEQIPLERLEPLEKVSRDHQKHSHYRLGSIFW